MHSLLTFLLVVSSQLTVGLNCTGDEDGGCQEVVCPGDSEPLSPEGGCKCAPARCHEPPPCSTGVAPVLKKKASLKPGDCCDVYECPSTDQIEQDCSWVICPEEENVHSCPADSYKLPIIHVEGECCPRPQGCACFPLPCTVPTCTPPSQLTILAKGDGRPGSCCPIYQCTSHRGSNRTCVVDGKVIEEGGKWSLNKCSECRCDNGLAFCTSLSECPTLDCEDQITLPDSCCPVCAQTTPTIDNNIEEVEKLLGCKSVNGTIYEHGSHWKLDDCTNCTCFDGRQECHAALCYHSCANATFVKGECCPVCEESTMFSLPKHCPSLDDCPLKCKNGFVKNKSNCFTCQCKGSNNTCIVDGQVIEDGGKWLPNKCSECHCDKGLALCKALSQCPPLSDFCEDPITPPGSCCPVCPESSEITSDVTDEKIQKLKGCESSNGVIHEHEAHWKIDDCTNCTCYDGKQVCHAAFCYNTCINPIIVEGECCPVCNDTTAFSLPQHCPSLSNCLLKCKNGFVKDESNCFICQCKEDTCKLTCLEGYKRDSNGREICECSTPSRCIDLTSCSRKCKHGYRTNTAGCEICKCCKPLDSCNKICPHGFKVKSGCPVCNCQGASDVSDELIDLHCTTEQGEKRDDGESWEDHCRQCYCSQGKEMCTLIVCPKLDCPEPLVFSKNSCCPTCPGSKGSSLGIGEGACFGDNGSVKREGEEWKLGNCVKCRCLGAGKVVCMREACPPAPCLRPLAPPPGSCCPYCPSLPQPYQNEPSCGDGREAGMQWRESECKSCVCINGVSTCYDENCDDSPCDTPVIVKNQCCPVCTDGWMKPVGECRLGNVTFAIGSELDSEPCLRCSCLPGPSMSCRSHCSKGGGWWHKEVVYLCLVSLLVFCSCIVAGLATRHYCARRRDRLKLGQSYQSGATAYQYKYVPTYDVKPPI